MRLIAHRGNTSGPSEKENQIDHLRDAINAGYDVELDLWSFKDLLWLGHDGPEYFIAESFLLEIGHAAWIHCKNLDALHFLNSTYPQLNYFWHQEDDFTLTSQGFIWTYPGKELSSNSILVMPESIPGGYVPNVSPYAICSDYVSQLDIAVAVP